MRRISSISMFIISMLLLVSCGAASDTTPTASPGTDPVSTPIPGTPMPAMSIGNVIWADATDPTTGAPDGEITLFIPTSAAIIAAVEVTNVPEGAEFTATWTINNQPVSGTEMHVATEEYVVHGWLNFGFILNSGEQYPVGQLGVTITSSDGTMRESSVEIGFP